MRRAIRLAVLVGVTLAMTACVNLQCAAGQDVTQIQEVDPLVGMAVVFVAGTAFMLALAAGFSGRGGE